ncbi:MAG: OmpA family protein [Sandaracinaceae bacterium]|nr:OmpA family protein [Sandaracinaceae bacterium]
MTTKLFESILCAASLVTVAACGGSSANEPQTTTATVAMNQETTNRECGDGTVLFATGSAELTENDRASLNRLAQCLNRHDMDTLYVTGTADPRGDAEANHALGEQRAEAVASYLRSAGCEAQFIIRSRGEAGADDTQVLWPADRSAQVSQPVDPTAGVGVGH